MTTAQNLLPDIADGLERCREDSKVSLTSAMLVELGLAIQATHIIEGNAIDVYDMLQRQEKAMVTMRQIISQECHVAIDIMDRLEKVGRTQLTANNACRLWVGDHPNAQCYDVTRTEQGIEVFSLGRQPLPSDKVWAALQEDDLHPLLRVMIAINELPGTTGIFTMNSQGLSWTNTGVTVEVRRPMQSIVVSVSGDAGHRMLKRITKVLEDRGIPKDQIKLYED